MRSNALMAWAFANDRVEYEDGGYQITNPLTVGRNPNVASYEYYDQLPISQTNEFTTVTYYWSRVAGSVIISDQEEDENRGESAIFKLMKAKMDVLEESIKEQFSSTCMPQVVVLIRLGLHLLFLMIPLQVLLVVSTVQLKRSGVHLLCFCWCTQRNEYRRSIRRYSPRSDVEE
jgi:hypothetical protein